MTDDQLGHALKQHFAREASDETGAARLMAKLAGALPRQKHRMPWPNILLDWQFAPAWPRMAALAGCAALGFVVGSASLDRFMTPVTGPDLAFAVFEPEALTGLRP
jgi:hypothetical protein